jgi:hypothetical protein
MISKHLAKVEPPMCSACIYGKFTKPPWRNRASPRKAPRTVTMPEERIAIDQLEYGTPRFIG